MDNYIISVFEEQEDVFTFPLTTEKDAKLFVEALHKKGCTYEAISKEIKQETEELEKWRSNQDASKNFLSLLLDRINAPIQDGMAESDVGASVEVEKLLSVSEQAINSATTQQILQLQLLKQQQLQQQQTSSNTTQLNQQQTTEQQHRMNKKQQLELLLKQKYLAKQKNAKIVPEPSTSNPAKTTVGRNRIYEQTTNIFTCSTTHNKTTTITTTHSKLPSQDNTTSTSKVLVNHENTEAGVNVKPPTTKSTPALATNLNTTGSNATSTPKQSNKQLLTSSSTTLTKTSTITSNPPIPSISPITSNPPITSPPASTSFSKQTTTTLPAKSSPTTPLFTTPSSPITPTKPQSMTTYSTKPTSTTTPPTKPASTTTPSPKPLSTTTPSTKPLSTTEPTNNTEERPPSPLTTSPFYKPQTSDFSPEEICHMMNYHSDDDGDGEDADGGYVLILSDIPAGHMKVSKLTKFRIKLLTSRKPIDRFKQALNFNPDLRILANVKVLDKSLKSQLIHKELFMYSMKSQNGWYWASLNQIFTIMDKILLN